jgi:hypothetical protein
MQIKQNPKSYLGVFLCFVFLLAFSTASISQTTYLPQGAEENILIERLDIKLQKDSIFVFSKSRPYSREYLIPAIERRYRAALALDSVQLGMDSANLNTDLITRLTKVDLYNMRRALVNSLEWVSGEFGAFRSKRPWGKTFYQTPGTLFEVHVKDFDLALNPVLQFQVGKEKDYDETLFLNTRGVHVRGRIANKIGFDSYLTDNQERDPLYVQDWEKKFQSVPGEGYYKSFKTSGYDYFDARGYFTFGVTKYIDVAFGYDKNFIGNGYRSLFLSDFSNNILFLKLNTRIWRFNYQNLFMELNATEPRGPDRLLKKKYAAMHHLDINLTKSLNVGLFEGIIFGRPDHFEFGYLNPIIFYRSIEQQNGSFDNAVVGADFKVNVAHTLQFYGQLLFDEFVLAEVKKNRGAWVNKWGIQAGAKYVDALGIKNLDLQFETNIVRPFTYSHSDSVANYTHYNQPLAHPLGANFYELIGVARYQPAPKWLIQGKLFFWNQGLDSSAESFGSNIFLPNVSPYRTKDYGYRIGDGLGSKAVIASFLVSYELKQNLFIDVSMLFRKQNIDASPTTPALSKNTSIFSLGVRLNMHRREFEF